MPLLFDNGRANYEGFPPAPVLWVTAIVDTLCLPLQCSQWREAIGVPDDSWFAAKVPSLSTSLPDLLSYGEFLEQQQEALGENASGPWSVGSLYKYAMETDSTELGNLSTPTACLALLFLMLIIRRIKKVLLPYFSSLGRKAGRRTHGVEWEKANEVRIVKFGEYVYRLIFHSVIAFFGVYYFIDKPWWAFEGMSHVGGMSLFQGFPNQPIAPGMTWYYLLQAAYNLDAMVSLLELSFEIKLQSPLLYAKRGSRSSLLSRLCSPVRLEWSKTVRGDFAEMFVHHLATNLLIFGSSICRMNRCGSMLFLIHDVSDVPVDLSKLANFLKWKLSTIFFFVTMALTWLVMRLYVLPFVCFRAFLKYAFYTCEDRTFPALLYICYRHFFQSLVVLLIMLHVSWFLMFIRMFITLVTKYECHDYSEHKSGEQHHTVGNGHGKMNGKKHS